MRIFCTTLLLFVSTLIHAQSYKKVRVGFGIGFSSGHPFPQLIYLEPSYRITDQWSVGARLEGGTISTDYANDLLTGSYGINGQFYFFETDRLRIYAGAGVSLYTLGNGIGRMSDSGQNFEKDKIGFYPRLGLDLGHFTLNLEYNMMPLIKVESWSIPYNGGPSYVTYASGNYFAAKMGISIGGGKKK